ncbi:hypothetical protein HELRODRAFT_170855 [Helobdella robusta]|uniref:Uncharacterized protein n=1 Tax=Helobdella robusta TaxID=6412 RepID=T1F3I6_HELRO|nr:hypothetical protein HELRODRAFT_170855 [Helobdella robusta]ESO06835.1 hypothetical protein HELRODRAFT_170855 [Helobdella robusta]
MDDQHTAAALDHDLLSKKSPSTNLSATCNSVVAATNSLLCNNLLLSTSWGSIAELCGVVGNGEATGGLASSSGNSSIGGVAGGLTSLMNINNGPDYMNLRNPSSACTLNVVGVKNEPVSPGPPPISPTPKFSSDFVKPYGSSSMGTTNNIPPYQLHNSVSATSYHINKSRTDKLDSNNNYIASSSSPFNMNHNNLQQQQHGVIKNSYSQQQQQHYHSMSDSTNSPYLHHNISPNQSYTSNHPLMQQRVLQHQQKMLEQNLLQVDQPTNASNDASTALPAAAQFRRSGTVDEEDSFR